MCFAASPDLAAKATLTGNPVRPAVVAAAATPYPAAGDPLRLLDFRRQPRRADHGRCRPRCDRAARNGPACAARHRPAGPRGGYGPRAHGLRDLSVTAEIAAFFPDLPARMAASHLIVSRSGASTVAELSAIGRPAILIPLPHALDQDQFANAGVLESAGGAIRLVQEEFTPRRLAAEIAALAAAPQRLAAMAAAAQSLGRLDAADRLADLVLEVAARRANK